MRRPHRRSLPASHQSQRRPSPPLPRARAEHGARRRRQVGHHRRPLDLHERQDDRVPLRSPTPSQPDRGTRRRVGTGDQWHRRHRRHPAERPRGVLDAARRDRRTDGHPRPALTASRDDRRTRHPPYQVSRCRPRTSTRHLEGDRCRHRLRPSRPVERDRPSCRRPRRRLNEAVGRRPPHQPGRLDRECLDVRPQRRPASVVRRARHPAQQSRKSSGWPMGSKTDSASFRSTARPFGVPSFELPTAVSCRRCPSGDGGRRSNS